MSEQNWQSGAEMKWTIYPPRQILGFEVRGGRSGVVNSLRVNCDEQLLAPKTPMAALLLKAAPAILCLPPCDTLEITTEGFSGELRPVLSEKPPHI